MEKKNEEKERYQMKEPHITYDLHVPDPSLQNFVSKCMNFNHNDCNF